MIARAHYGGRVKRRLFVRFVSRGAVANLAIGESGQLADGRAFKVVEAAQLADGRWEFLAMAPLAAVGAVEECGRGGFEQGRVRRADRATAQGVSATASAGPRAVAQPLRAWAPASALWRASARRAPARDDGLPPPRGANTLGGGDRRRGVAPALSVCPGKPLPE